VGDDNTSVQDDEKVNDDAQDQASTDELNGTDEAAAAKEQGESDVSGENEQAETEVESLKEELQSAKDQALRVAAEMQNVRKRAERDVENAHKYGQEKLIAALLPVLDNLDRAIDAIKKSSEEESADDSS
jgi:molecular chaperone GrpE